MFEDLIYKIENEFNSRYEDDGYTLTFEDGIFTIHFDGEFDSENVFDVEEIAQFFCGCYAKDIKIESDTSTYTNYETIGARYGL